MMANGKQCAISSAMGTPLIDRKLLLKKDNVMTYEMNSMPNAYTICLNFTVPEFNIWFVVKVVLQFWSNFVI